MRIHNYLEINSDSLNNSLTTTVGRFIRRTSIDEFRQLLKVLQGQRALIGLPPHVITHNDYYSGKFSPTWYATESTGY